jgi:hypothetical protein
VLWVLVGREAERGPQGSQAGIASGDTAATKWSYWYLSASPELLSLAAERLEAPQGRQS